MKKTTKLVFMLVLGAGSFLSVEAGHALSGGASGVVSIAGQAPDGQYAGTADS